MAIAEPNVPPEAHKQLAHEQFYSVDSAPKRLARTVPASAAPQVLAVTLICSIAATFLVDVAEPLERFFPEGDFYFARYDGTYTLPLRLFFISFYVGYASAISASLGGKIRHGLDLVLTFMLVCAVFDLMTLAMLNVLDVHMPLHLGMILSGLAGLMIFSVKILHNGDLPAPTVVPLHDHIRTPPLMLAGVTMGLAAFGSMSVASLDLPVVAALRQDALLGGIGPGVFLFLPLLFIVLNWVAAIRWMLRPPRAFSPPVTIIVPAFNEAHIIAHTIRAVDEAAGRYEGELHLLVIDNNSADDTREVAQAALARAKKLSGRLIVETTRGKAHALSRGIEETETEFVIRIDADTQVSPDAVWRVMRHFRDEHVGAAGGLALSPGGGIFDTARQLEVNLKVGLDQVAYGAADCIFGIPGMFAAYRTKAIRGVGGFAHGMNGEDTDVALRIGESGFRLVVDPSATFVSEVPRTFAHMREQRQRWFRSIFHVSARNHDYFKVSDFTVRSKLMMPYMLLNTARRAVALPFLVFGLLFLAVAPDPRSAISMQAVLAFVLGAPFIMVTLATLVMLRFRDLLGLPKYLLFRLFRSYLTLESMLSITYDKFSHR
jgi:cellulose synthase/poly-beta-1,6-N-acetylglucosamine synthase-like glycosyltransferase